jgi:hypothetical protein
VVYVQTCLLRMWKHIESFHSLCIFIYFVVFVFEDSHHFVYFGVFVFEDSHNINELMSCVHGRSSIFKNQRLRLSESHCFGLNLKSMSEYNSLAQYCYASRSDGVQLGPLHTRDWEPMTITLQAHSLVETAEPVKVQFTLRLRDQRSMWMQDECKVYIDSYMTSNGSHFMITWIVFKNHLSDVGLTQNHETMTLRMLTTVDLFYFIVDEDLHDRNLSK